jgi:BirA family transcriptional regulator, biotin operon repressor / biotin---[acetyl-CoA-carboxylase] ligase
MNTVQPPILAPLINQVGWTISLHSVVGSTNDIAASRPGWNAVIADTQTGGRGRYRRTWVSDEGGIWLSAVLPTPGPASDWSILPLAAGWAVREALSSLGVHDLRLRWPNDVMVGPAKLAGILVERFRPGTAVIGLGLNYLNHPEAEDTSLSGLVVRLADLLPVLPPRQEIIDAILAHLARAQKLIAAQSLAQLLPTLNEAWTGGRVSLELHGSPSPLVGKLVAVDASGNLEIHPDHAPPVFVSPLAVERLRECD